MTKNNRIYAFTASEKSVVVDLDKIAAIDYKDPNEYNENGILRITLTDRDFVSYAASKDIWKNLVEAYAKYMNSLD